jgi:hypothetical protein
MRTDRNDMNLSNYVMTNDLNMSNYVVATSNIVVLRTNRNDLNLSNYVVATSNIVVLRTDRNNLNLSNYVLTTSNLIATRITNLTTDMINENGGAMKRFIINNEYNNHLSIYGNLTVSSNLIVLGASTTLETEVYTTERLEITNANNTSRALVIKQNDLINDIIRASNRDNAVYTVGNNGDVRIAGNYIRNNRDVLLDTSNYVLETSNVIAKRIDSNIAILNNTLRLNDANNSNYILASSNNLAFSINNIRSAWVISPTSVYSLTNVSIGTTSNIDTLTVDGAIICSKGITTSYSDNRLKDYTSNIANPIALINRLNGFHFTPNDLAMSYGFSKNPDVGLSAQEVQSVLPEIVKLAPFDMARDDYNNLVSKSGDNFLTICYEKMAPLFVECIKALKKEINDLREEVAELRGDLGR